MAPRLRYSQFADRIDVDAFEAAIGFSPIATDRGNDIGHCPFPENHKHGDTSGKFAIHRDKKVFNCFVCGGGDLLSLAMLTMGIDDTERATDWLYQFTYGEQQDDDDFADYLIAMLEDAADRVETTPYFNSKVLERFQGPTDYFRSRGISDAVIERLGLRYADQVMKPAPMKVVDGTKVKIDDDYIGPASIWPHYWQGRLVGWQYRWQDWDADHTQTPKWLPKWTNTSDFPKSTTLYNYDAALKTGELVIVCESLATVGFCESWGVPAVAWFGSKPTETQFRLLRRFTRGVILAPDNDSNAAGDKIYAAGRYLERYIPVYILDKVQPEDVGADADADGLDLGDYAKVPYPGGHLFDHLINRRHEWGDLMEELT